MLDLLDLRVLAEAFVLVGIYVSRYGVRYVLREIEPSSGKNLTSYSSEGTGIKMKAERCEAGHTM